MKTRETELIAFPDDAELAALRAWYAGLGARAAVARYLGDRKAPGASARAALGRIRRALISYAASHHRPDLAEVFISERSAGSADTVARVIETLRSLPAHVRMGYQTLVWKLPLGMRNPAFRPAVFQQTCPFFPTWSLAFDCVEYFLEQVGQTPADCSCQPFAGT